MNSTCAHNYPILILTLYFGCSSQRSRFPEGHSEDAIVEEPDEVADIPSEQIEKLGVITSLLWRRDGWKPSGESQWRALNT